MSYLDTPRLLFAGGFQCDVSTINNQVVFYDNATFDPADQERTTDGTKGGWNPDGTGIFRLDGCRITGARLGARALTRPEDDPVIGLGLENADDRVLGKLVDLDPQQQMCSQIWGMRLRLTDGGRRALFAGEYKPAPFTNLWRRQQTSVFLDQTLAAVYQSVLQGVVWEDGLGSAVLEALRAAAEEDCLSINLNVYGYGRDPTISRYTFGRVAGAIGPYRSGEPRHFVAGRQMIAATPPTNPFVPAGGVYNFQAKLPPDTGTLTADFGNCLQIKSAAGEIAETRDLALAVLTAGEPTSAGLVSADQITRIGPIPYGAPGWYETTAGVVDVDLSGTEGLAALAAGNPLLLVAPAAGGGYQVVVAESPDGLYVRADDFVCRIEPGATATVDLCATRYGTPTALAVSVFPNMGMISASEGEPPVGTPDGVVSYPTTVETDGTGWARLPITARTEGAGNPRGYIDGQLYGVGCRPASQGPNTRANFWNYVSVLAFDRYEVPEHPTWTRDVQPIMQQYANLYPIMSRRLFDLADYDAVVENLNILRLAFSLPRENPNHMPVTRDLSTGRRDIILAWMNAPGADGLPLRGDPAAAVASAESAVAVAPPEPAGAVVARQVAEVGIGPGQARGKTEFYLKYQAARRAEETP